MVIHSEGNGPFAFRAVLGCCIVGPISQKNASGGKKLCNRTAVIEAATGNLAKHYFETKNQVQKNDLKQIIDRMYQAVFSEENWDSNKWFKILRRCHLKTSIF